MVHRLFHGRWSPLHRDASLFERGEKLCTCGLSVRNSFLWGCLYLQSLAFYSSHCRKLSEISYIELSLFTWRETEAEREGTELCGAAGWSSHKGPLPAPSGQLGSPPEPLCSVHPWLAEPNNGVSLTGGVKSAGNTAVLMETQTDRRALNSFNFAAFKRCSLFTFRPP